MSTPLSIACLIVLQVLLAVAGAKVGKYIAYMNAGQAKAALLFCIVILLLSTALRVFG